MLKTNPLTNYSNKEEMNVPIISSENQISASNGLKLVPNYNERSFGRDITNSCVPSQLQSKTDPQVADYIFDIYELLHQTEETFMPRMGYMLHQEKINEKMRSILIDWLIEVHFKFKLVDETLYLTVNIIDRFLQTVRVPKENLQLLGVSAMLIACKYEEIYPPEVKDFVYITDNAYTAQQVLSTECLILKTLNFNLTVPSSFRFLQRFSRLCEIDEFSFNFARFVLELSLVDYKFIRFKPSVMAVSAIITAQRILKFACRDPALATQYNENDVRCCAKEMILVVVKAQNSSLQGVRKKFMSDKYMAVAKVEVKI